MKALTGIPGVAKCAAMIDLPAVIRISCDAVQNRRDVRFTCFEECRKDKESDGWNAIGTSGHILAGIEEDVTGINAFSS